MRAVRLLLFCPRCRPPSTAALAWRRGRADVSSTATPLDSPPSDLSDLSADSKDEDVALSLDALILSSDSVAARSGDHELSAQKAMTRALWDGERERFNKTFANGLTHVTSINASSDERSIVRLSVPSKRKRIPAFKKLSDLPNESLVGLKSSLADCKQPAKVLQRHADDLSKKLVNRNFPATPGEVREARRVVMDEILENDVNVQAELRNPKSEELINRLIYRKAQQLLSKTRYNWKPLKLETREAVAAFALSRMSPYFAEMQRVFTEFNRLRYVPETVLDFGSGIGAAFWAAHERWGHRIGHYCLVDINQHMRNFSMDVMRGSNYGGTGEFVNKSVYFRKNLPVSAANNAYDLVILHRTLIEIPSREERLQLIEELWKRTRHFLVIVETPLEDGFRAIMEARDFILTASNEFDFEVAKEALDRMAKLDMATIHFLANKRISDYEKLCVVREKLGDDFHIPTKVERGYVHAPCPHDQGCPRMSRWVEKFESCDFHVRWKERRADHGTQSYMRDGTLTGKFSYVIMAKGERPPPPEDAGGQNPPRLLRRSKGYGCTTCEVCTENDGIQRFTVSKRSKDIYKRIKLSNESQLLPVNYELVKSSSGTKEMIDGLIEEATTAAVEKS